jgi:putative acetyltransferase
VSGVVIRPEETRHERAIFEIHARAFPSDGEARLVDALRAAGAATISLVAECDERVVGHILFSPVRVDGAGGSFAALGLAPVAVVPERQRDGIGSALVRAGLAVCRSAGHSIVFVLGHASYYPRFGFEPAAPRGLFYSDRTRDYAPVFFVAELEPGALAGRTGIVHYRPEFAGL